MPHSYSKLGIHFEYPDNWTLDEQEARDTRNAVTVYAPGGAFWSVNVQAADDGEPEALASSVVEAMRQVYTEMDVEPVREVIEGWEFVGYDMNFYCLDLTNTAQVLAVPSPFGTFVVLAQAEDREHEKLAPVFRAMTVSLVRGSLGKIDKE